MKKIFSMALMAVLMLGMTSCLGSDTDDIQRASVYIYNMPYDSENPSTVLPLTESNTPIEINFSKNTIKLDITALAADGVRVQFSTGELKMTVGPDAYLFSAASFPSTGAGISNFSGKYNPQTGMVYYEYDVNNVHHIVSTASFAYNYATMNIYDAPGGELLYTTNEIAFGFIPKAGDDDCTLVISGFKSSNTSTVINKLSYDDIDYTMVPGAGFTIMDDDADDEGGHTAYNIKNIKGAVSNRGLMGQVSFTMGDKYVEMTGSMFYIAK